jgi:hypothetical protein
MWFTPRWYEFLIPFAAFVAAVIGVEHGVLWLIHHVCIGIR